MNSVIVTAQGTTISIDSQTTKTFGNYVKTLVKFHNFTKTTPDYIFINLHGKTTSSTTGHLIVYGVKGYVSSVEPKVYDTAFVVENGKMVMETDLDMNGHSILDLPTTHWINGVYKKSEHPHLFTFSGKPFIVFPKDCKITGYSVYIMDKLSVYPKVAVIIQETHYFSPTSEKYQYRNLNILVRKGETMAFQMRDFAGTVDHCLITLIIEEEKSS